MSFPNPDNYGNSCECGPGNTTPPPSNIQDKLDNLKVSPFIFTNGGALTMTDSEADAGDINTSAFDINSGGYINSGGGDSGPGGYIDTSNAGGSINTSVWGGSINTSGYDDSHLGGSINTSAGGGVTGGSINTSSGGGSIDTTGTGSIQFGVLGTRTTLNGSATADQTVTLPDITGTLPVAFISSSTALNFGNIASGGFLDLTITLAGAAISDSVFVTCLDTAGRGATNGKLIFESFVSATNTVTVRAHNPTSGSIDPASYNFKIAVIKTA